MADEISPTTAVPTPPAAPFCQTHREAPAAATCVQCGQALCAACVVKSPVRQGAFCAACAAALESSWAAKHLENPPPPAATAVSPRCAFHGERVASATCDRCGNFLCAACAIPSPWDEKTYCKDCLARLEAEGGGGHIPWEDRSQNFFSRYWRSVTQVILAPGDFFHRMPQRGWVPPITFLYHTMVYATLLMVLMMWMILPKQMGFVIGMSKAKYLGMMALSMGIAGLVAPLLQFLWAGWMHLHLYLFGARRGYEATYRMTAYLSALFFPYMIAALFGTLMGMGARSLAPLYILIILFGIFALWVSTTAASNSQRMNGAMAFLAILLTYVEGFLFYRYVLLPLVAKGAGVGLTPFL